MATRRNKSRRPDLKKELPDLTPMQEALLEEANRKVTIVADGHRQEVLAGHLVARKLLQTAVNGSTHALSNAIHELIIAQQLEEARIRKEVEIGQQFKERQQRKLHEGVREGRNPETVLPHPDDIVVTVGQGYEVQGPYDADELEIIKRNCAIRDVLILQAVLDERLGTQAGHHRIEMEDLAGAQGSGFAGASPLLLAHFMNSGLPDRYRLSDFDILTTMERFHRLTKRELLKQTHQAWASIGRPKPRGWQLPPLDETRARLEQLLSHVLAIVREIKSGEIRTEREILSRLDRLIRH